MESQGRAPDWNIESVARNLMGLIEERMNSNPTDSVSRAGTLGAGVSGAGTSRAGTSRAGTSRPGTSGAGVSGAGTSRAGTGTAGVSGVGTSRPGTSGAGVSGAGSTWSGYQSPQVPPNCLQTMVSSEMQRSFPGIFRGKRRFKSVGKPVTAKSHQFHFYLLPTPSSHTPKGDDELRLCQAGLGMKVLTIPEDTCHDQISDLLQNEYPKMKALNGSWMFYKASGGNGQRRLTVISPQVEGYTTIQLKRATNGGKNILYIVPLQGELDVSPLPRNSSEFSKMPKANCTNCQETMPLHLLALHVDSCSKDDDDDEDQDSDVECVALVPSMVSCPICSQLFPTDCLEEHASSCGESSDALDNIVIMPEAGMMEAGSEEAWKNIRDPEEAAAYYRRHCLSSKEDEPTLKIRIDIRDDVEDQESRILSFYKSRNIDWARPFQAKLEGDVAIGEGVNRHFLSMAMHKLQHGFALDCGTACGTVLFEGQTDHLIPSTSQVLVQNELFVLAGRIIGHCFLHGGPRLTGISEAVLHVLSGETPQTATINLEDVADMDIRGTIQPLYEEGQSQKKEDDCKDEYSILSEDQRAAINDLALAWDFPVLTKTNSTWLLHNLLQHAVLGRNSRQLKQLKQGLKESLIWPMLESRPDTVVSVFPRQSKAECNAQVLLDQIKWPEEGGMADEDGYSVAVQCRVMGYLRQFLTTVSQEQLKKLVKFWVGWEIPMADMTVEVVRAEHPTSSTCFKNLRLPGHYHSYEEFSNHLQYCISANDSGFGLL